MDRELTPSEDPYADLPPHLRQWAPGGRTIREPVPLGERADATAVGLALWTPSHGAKHPLMGGATGAGKTNTLNVLTAGVAACQDAVLWVIEVAKAGQGAAPWLPCLDWLATTPAEAVDMLRCAVAIIQQRSRDLARAAACGSGKDKVIPSPDLPQLVIMIDEAAALHGVMSGPPTAVARAAEATELARQIAQTGRSAGVGLFVATQRPTVASLGNDGDYRSQLHPSICLRMNRRADIGFVLQGVDLDAVDTTLFIVPGLLYLQDGPDSDPLPVRSYALYDPATVHRLAGLLAAGRPALDVASREAAGEAYARRPSDPFASDQVSVRRPVPTRSHTALENARSAVAAGENLAPVPAVPLADLHLPADAPTSETTAERPVRDAVLAVLVEAGPAGLSLREVTEHIEARRGGTTHRGSVHRALRALADAGQVRQSGEKGSYRYHAVSADSVPADQHAA